MTSPVPNMTINLGKIKFKWKGAYSAPASYKVDDVVEYGGSTFVCVADVTGVTPSVSATEWDLMALGGDPASILTTQGDILYKDSSGLQNLGIGTNGQFLKSNGTEPVWGSSNAAYELVYHNQSTYSGGIVAASTTRAWLPGLYVDYTPQFSNSKIFMNAQFAHADSGTGSITLAYIYKDTSLILATNLSGHDFYVSRWNNMSYWFDSWGTSSSRIGIKGGKYSSSYNIYWHSSGYTGYDESPSNGSPHSIARNALFTIQEWKPV